MQAFFHGFHMEIIWIWVPCPALVHGFLENQYEHAPFPLQFSTLSWAQWNAQLDEDWKMAQNALYIGPFYKKE